MTTLTREYWYLATETLEVWFLPTKQLKNGNMRGLELDLSMGHRKPRQKSVHRQDFPTRTNFYRVVEPPDNVKAIFEKHPRFPA